MNPQFSQDYNVDERYKGLRGHGHTVDNNTGLNFVRGYIAVSYTHLTLPTSDLV